ncbi:MAG: DNA mismatch repair endonuclease MutL [Lachnospiraceae bacterium]|nr:DNA mismatch repair endonuclease MutL [Lachnospiraceae bacterium]
MGNIHLLDNSTIDKIAAGEVVERPASIVKELVENAMDSGADAITVEIKGGGIDYIRVTDNGCGISAEDMPNAFLRHATSKIISIDDLNSLNSMGFRGEALASIASVCKVTMITKCAGELMGHKLEVNGSVAGEIEDIGAPEGTTVIAAHLFYNTPVRRKFLKTAAAEGNTIAELMERLALARPDISYKFVQNGNTRFMTSGSGDLKEVIHRIYGREAAKTIVPVSCEIDGIRIDGYLGSPAMNRPNRNFENYFLNRRYIKSDIISRGIEEGYKGYMMQHKFPFCVLHINIDSTCIDVNVHPSKMDVRFSDKEAVFDGISKGVADTLHEQEMIPKAEGEGNIKPEIVEAPEPFEKSRTKELKEETTAAYDEPEKPVVTVSEENDNVDESVDRNGYYVDQLSHGNDDRDIFDINFDDADDKAFVVDLKAKPDTAAISAAVKTEKQPIPEDPWKNATQLSMLPTERVISANARKQYNLLGCVFNTYWIFSYQDKIYFVDQHAAHEKVNYERIVKQYENNNVYVQQLAPPIIVSLSHSEAETLEEYREELSALGFNSESFGGSEVAITTVPLELYKKEPRGLFLEILNDLALRGGGKAPGVIDRVLATMACKAAVKGGDVISREEMDAVLDELLSLKNPYHCPHGRPTIFSMSRTDLEKKFKRIVS